MPLPKFERFTDIHGCVKFLSIGEIYQHACGSRSSPASATTEEADAAQRKAMYTQCKDMLKQAFEKGEIQLHDPDTYKPQVFWDTKFVVARKQFTKFFSGVGIEVVEMPDFILPLRPLEVPTWLREYPSNAIVRLDAHDDSGYGNATCGQLIVQIESQIERQRTGLFSVCEAAHLLAEKYPTTAAENWKNRIHRGFQNNTLRLYGSNTLTIQDKKEFNDFFAHVNINELNVWLSTEGDGSHRFPDTPAESKPQNDSLAGPVPAILNGEPPLQPGRNKRANVDAWVKWQAKQLKKDGDNGDTLATRIKSLADEYGRGYESERGALTVPTIVKMLPNGITGGRGKNRSAGKK